MSKTILVSLAHPDDEAFGLGGMLARYAAEGAHVALICATRGEVGEISDSALATPETLATVREGELRCAADALGIQELIFLDYRDSGMVGTAENADPRAFMNAPAEEVTARLVGIIRRIKPEIVITFEPNGVYGHPDHIASHTHTVAAFHAASDDTRYPEQGAAWQPQRLFYNAISRSFLAEMQTEMEAAGVDTTEFNSLNDFAWLDEQMTVTIDVSAFLDQKRRALECHRTQFGTESPFHKMSADAVRRIMGQEQLALVVPAVPAGTRLADLYDGLDKA